MRESKASLFRSMIQTKYEILNFLLATLKVKWLKLFLIMYFKSIIPNVIISTCNQYKTYNEIFYIPILSLQNSVTLSQSTLRLAAPQVFNSHLRQVAAILHSMGLKVFIKSEMERLLCWALLTTTANIPRLYLLISLFIGLFLDGWLISLWIDVGLYLAAFCVLTSNLYSSITLSTFEFSWISQFFQRTMTILWLFLWALFNTMWNKTRYKWYIVTSYAFLIPFIKYFLSPPPPIPKDSFL